MRHRSSFSIALVVILTMELPSTILGIAAQDLSMGDAARSGEGYTASLAFSKNGVARD